MNWLARVIIKTHRAIVRYTSPPIAPKQAEHISSMVERAMRHAAEEETSPGRALYLLLPDGVANILVDKPYDPYLMFLNRESMRYWLETHIIFNEAGEAVVFHHEGSILWTEPNTNLKGLFDAV